MDNTERQATFVANRAKSVLSDTLLDVEDSLLPHIVSYTAIDITREILRHIHRANNAIQPLFGEMSSEECLNLTFNDIALKLCSDDVLKLAVELLRDMRHKSR